MEKSRYVRVIEGEEVGRNDPIKYFLPTGVMAIEVTQNEEISGGEKELVLPCVGEERIGGA